MTPEAKKALSKTIRGLRERLLEDLHASTESAYRLSVRTQDAGLAERPKALRRRLEAWIGEQQRAEPKGKGKEKTQRSADDFRREAEKQAAYTLLNRLVILKLMEAPGAGGEPMRKPPVVTGGWESRAYKDFRQLAPALVREDETAGYGVLLRLVFEELAVDLPGVFGPAGVGELVPIPAGTLRHVVDELNRGELESCWTDDMTLGWVYQYWNDPEREALDEKIAGGGKIEPHEIASKTQMFTERYMVDWLLQNSLGPMWLAMCKKHGWTAEVEADGTLARLEERRTAWRAKREAGEVELTELMPLETDTERRWAYYVPQPIPDDAVEKAPESVRELKILDPAVGSGHFLVVAMDLLVALYREEARHRGEERQEAWSDAAIVERIVAENLHGIDLDRRAVQIAAAALWLKAQQLAPGCHPERMNLVASDLRLASLPDDDAALVELRKEVERETGIPDELTDTLVHALRGADHLGSLLKVDAALEKALDEHDAELGSAVAEQGSLLEGFAPKQKRLAIPREEARGLVLKRLEGFLARRTGGDDLGLRLRGEQLAAGVRFVRIVREGAYDLVVANPPYQGTSKMAASKYVEDTYKLGKADLFAAFLVRGLELVREGGTSAMLTMRNWMFIKQYSGLREWLLETYDLRSLGDFAIGAFDEVPNDVLSVCVSTFRATPPVQTRSVAQQPTPNDDKSYDRQRTKRKRAATLCHVGRHEFEPAALKVVPEWPLVYWWDEHDVTAYQAGTLGEKSPARAGLQTSDDTRFLRLPWEVEACRIASHRHEERVPERHKAGWAPIVAGASGREWIEPLFTVLRWQAEGLEVREFPRSYPRNFESYFRPGVAFAMIGASFSARVHRYASVVGHKGASLVPPSPAEAVCALNSKRARSVLQSLNPGIGFEVGDVNRLPLFEVADAPSIFRVLEEAFAEHEAHREASVEFRGPGQSPWRRAQQWAQEAVDRSAHDGLSDYSAGYDREPPTDHISFALGCALGRFSPAGEGILNPITADLSSALPAGILFLDTTLDANDLRDSLGHPAAAQIHEVWTTHGPHLETKRKDVRAYLAWDFFASVHKGMYENRPIHWPLTSASKIFVAWVNIHRFDAQTLPVLLADHLHPTLTRIEGELADLQAARSGPDKKAARSAEKQYDKAVKARDELKEFIANVEQCANAGPPPPDTKTPKRDVDARYDPDLDDGVMINSAALWPLLEPQWKDPKKWWKELASAKGKKDYDWSHLAMKYWPGRVDKKCQEDPSLGVAHGCFWKYHPARAWAWELRLQDEIGPDFRIEEKPYRDDGGDTEHRTAYLATHPEEALAAVEKEALRRRGRGKDAKPIAELTLLEPGLWSALPEACWDLETKIIDKQGAPFRLHAPDEPQARAGYEKANPAESKKRAELLRSLGAPDMFDSVPE